MQVLLILLSGLCILMGNIVGKIYLLKTEDSKYIFRMRVIIVFFLTLDDGDSRSLRSKYWTEYGYGYDGYDDNMDMKSPMDNEDASMKPNDNHNYGHGKKK